ncbi:hypothetical protein BDV23DRAFT_70167 [Aspergillus alliaceus]|uniref:NWD NACHT-NTPase N-terminal domain-containing protein n=1 Tax=Petromyces alliaceus TaxID=209559 RepID=A0A5N7CCQ2_PETAA|nr:hypothetical protein BDV23DRAFT_70167 [Aspergillus alliaceus]
MGRDEQLEGLVPSDLKKFEDTKQVKMASKDKEIVVADEIRRIVHRIVAVKEVISAAISNEPHAALAWASALVGLTVSITDWL